MYRIGILGSENSHALAFSKLINLSDAQTGEYLYPDMKVVSVFGFDKEQAQKVAQEGGIEHVADSPDEMAGRIDAAMIVFRHGKYHAQYAIPFIKAGYPTWVDKPFTVDIKDSQEIVRCAIENRTPIMGGSTCKYVDDIITLKSELNNGLAGKILAGSLNYPANLASEYGGLFFYASHLIEMMLEVFGYDIKSVVATSLNDNITTAIVKYDDKQVTLNFVEYCYRCIISVVGDKMPFAREIDLSVMYKKGLDLFANMLRTGNMQYTFVQLVKPVLLLNAIEASLKNSREEAIGTFNI